MERIVPQFLRNKCISERSMGDFDYNCSGDRVLSGQALKLPVSNLAISSHPLASFVMPITPLSEKRSAKHGGDEHPISQQPAVNDETNRGYDLPNKQPPRYPLRATVTPLGVDLPADRRRQDDGCGNPADQLRRRRSASPANVSDRRVTERRRPSHLFP